MWLRPGPGRSAASATQSEGRKGGGTRGWPRLTPSAVSLRKKALRNFFFPPGRKEICLSHVTETSRQCFSMSQIAAFCRDLLQLSCTTSGVKGDLGKAMKSHADSSPTPHPRSFWLYYCPHSILLDYLVGSSKAHP